MIRLISSIFSLSLHTNSRLKSSTSPFEMGKQNFRLCNVSGFTTELLELKAENPSFHVLVIPGNPGVVSFYKEFVERVYEMLEGCASVTAIGHIGHTRKNWECRRLFSLQDQIDHKVDYIKHEFQNTEIPLLLVGHSIGSYISLEVLRRSPEQVKYIIGLYPFLRLNKESLLQKLIGKTAASQVISTFLSSLVAMLGLFPSSVSRTLVKRSIGKSWSATAVEALCSHLLQKCVLGEVNNFIRDAILVVVTKFQQHHNSVAIPHIAECPFSDDDRIRKDTIFNLPFIAEYRCSQAKREEKNKADELILVKQSCTAQSPSLLACRSSRLDVHKRKPRKIAFLFGIDDHWGPLAMFEQASGRGDLVMKLCGYRATISKQVPEVVLTIEREGHTHGFCCTEAGSVWVADHVVSLIKYQFQSKPISLVIPCCLVHPRTAARVPPENQIGRDLRIV
ncbi:hypothetical protein IFM89_020551 [Coptis chinensis]|uniref:Lipid droplet-associated hydrolase n=1 Tax=Coptis chinensis TaxID=261450 RepID=A0A835LSA1_9MAGN|nr:hypothetical protein IFM89_020551 [Coptis chinensis]